MTDGETAQSIFAQIIPFPRQFRPSIDGAQELDQAIHGLEQVTAALRANISHWRRSTDALTASLGEVTKSLQILDAKLKTIPTQLNRFGNEEIYK